MPIEENPIDGSINVNGTVIPRLVAEQLRLLGKSLSSYSEGELEEAIEACAFDCNLIDDDDGVDFEDSLTYDERKKEEDSGEIEPDLLRHATMMHIHAPHFCEQLAQERQKKLQPDDDEDALSVG